MKDQKGTLRVFGSIYSPSEQAVIFSQVFDSSGDPANAATVILNLFYPDGTKFLDNVTMTYIPLSNGLYQYEYTAPSASTRLVSDVKSTSPTAYGAEDVYVADWTVDIDNIISDLPSIRKVFITAGRAT